MFMSLRKKSLCCFVEATNFSSFNSSFVKINRRLVSRKRGCYNPCHLRQEPLVAVFGGGGGFFGVGTPELIVIGIVAWVVLGPKRLYSLSKDLGRVFGELRSSAEEAKSTFVTALESEYDDDKIPETNLKGSNESTDEPSHLKDNATNLEYSDPVQTQTEGGQSETSAASMMDRERKTFLEHLERVNSENPQPPAELPDILKSVANGKNNYRNSESAREYNIESQLATLEKEYQEAKERLMQEKKRVQQESQSFSEDTGRM